MAAPVPASGAHALTSSVPVRLVRMDFSATDVAHLRRCVELAREAFDEGSEPFGSVLVDASGAVRLEARNQEKDGDHTRHPELEIARWSAHHLSAHEREQSTVYTSGEHCPMCSAAHAYMGLGRIVFAVSSSQLSAWKGEWGADASTVAALPVHSVAPGTVAHGPVPELAGDLHDLHRAHLESRGRS